MSGATGLALLYPAFAGADCAWPPWIRARPFLARPFDGPLGHQITNAMARPYLMAAVRWPTERERTRCNAWRSRCWPAFCRDAPRRWTLHSLGCRVRVTKVILMAVPAAAVSRRGRWRVA